VTPGIAARMLAEGVVRLATAEEAMASGQRRRRPNELADQAAAAARVQFTVLSTAELNRLKGGPESSQD